MKRHLIYSLSLLLTVLFGIPAQAQSVSQNIEQALEGVVTVSVDKTIPIGKVLMGFRGTFSQEAYEKSLDLSDALSSGSGFVIEKSGKKYIVTNAHVVESASDEKGSIFVYSFNRKKYEVRVVGGDSFYDIAVLEFVNPPGNELRPLKFEKDIPKIATKVFALGNPLGEFPNTVTDGIVSAVNRSRDGVTGKFGFIQTTATLIWGNSGGPLVNEQGGVVGVNSQIQFHSLEDGSNFLMQQINFSLESPLTEKIVNSIIEKGKLSRAYLGIELSQSNRILKTKQGLIIGELLNPLPILTGLTDNSNGSAALDKYIGFAVQQINGISVQNLEEALGEFEKIRPATEVILTLTDGTSTKTVSFMTEELNPHHLEQLALNSLEQLPNLSVDANSPQVKIYASDNKKAMNQRVGYYLVGGGSDDNLWRVTGMSDLGALIRIYGLQGGVDYVMVNENYPDDVQAVSYIFSDNSDEFTRKLWY